MKRYILYAWCYYCEPEYGLCYEDFVSFDTAEELNNYYEDDELDSVRYSAYDTLNNIHYEQSDLPIKAVQRVSETDEGTEHQERTHQERREDGLHRQQERIETREQA